MEPRRTAVSGPLKLQIADDIRLRIETGELAPGDSLPTIDELVARWGCSANPVREAVGLLKQQGLINTRQGRASTVREPLRRIVRSSERHQAEKDLVLASELERRATGVAETDMGAMLDELALKATYDVIEAVGALATVFEVETGTRLLRRTYEMCEPRTRQRQACSVSYLPYDLISSNAALLDAANEPWPGGTQHQLHTVGVEIARVDDVVTAAVPSTAEAKAWELAVGVAMLRVRRISIDTEGRVVEVSDADFPADRTELRFVTPLKKGKFS